VKYYYN